METVLITGGNGLIGSALKSLVENDDNYYNIVAGGQNPQFVFVSSKEADLRNLSETEQLFLKYKPTKVIHLAAKVGGLYANIKYKTEFLNDNILIKSQLPEIEK